MNRSQVLKMLSDIIMEVDYDYWKGMFEEDFIADPELNADHLDRLVNVVFDHLGEADIEVDDE